MIKGRKRLTPQESKEVTRMRLIEAAQRLSIRKGFNELRRPKAVHDIFQRASEPAERIAEVREWFSNQSRLKDFIVLRMELGRSSMRDAELRRQELGTYAASVVQCFGATDGVPAGRPKIITLVLLAVAHGLGSVAIGCDPEWEHLCTEAARLAFERMSSGRISQMR